MIRTFLAGIAGKLLVLALAGGLIVGGYFYWEHVVTSRALIAAQRDALVELAKRQARTVEEKNQTDAVMRDKPDACVRVCAINGVASKLCQECKE